MLRIGKIKDPKEINIINIDQSNNKVGFNIDPSYVIDVSGSVRVSDQLIVEGDISGSGQYIRNIPASSLDISHITINDKQIFLGDDISLNASQWNDVSENNIYYNEGVVGIGTASPDSNYSLDVSGKINCNEILINGQALEQTTSNSQLTYDFTSGTIDDEINMFSNVRMFNDAIILGTTQCNNVLTVKHENVDEGTLEPSLLVEGHVSVTGTVITSSDRRLKINKEPIEKATEILKKLVPFVYDKYEDLRCLGKTHRESGLIAQDVFSNVPELRHLVNVPKEIKLDISGNINDDKCSSVPFALNYNGIIPYLIKGFQEQYEVNQKCMKKIDELLHELSEIKSQISKKSDNE